MTKLDYLNLAGEITDVLEPLIIDAQFYNDDVSEMAANISGSILELHIGVLTLLKSYADSHAVILIRTMQESFVNLQCLSEDASFLNQIHYDDAKQNQDIYKGMSKSYAPDSPQFLYMQAELKKTNKMIKDYQLIGIGYKSLSDRFKQIKTHFPNEYSVYALYCSYAHNNASNLYRRYGRGLQREFPRTLHTKDLIGFICHSFIFFIRTARLTPMFSSASIEHINKTIDSVTEKLQQFDQDFPA